MTAPSIASDTISLIGNTPLVAVDFLYRGEPRVIYAKQESLNLTGSIKDRMALHILRREQSSPVAAAALDDALTDMRMIMRPGEAP